jgi:hypothetical protein
MDIEDNAAPARERRAARGEGIRVAWRRRARHGEIDRIREAAPEAWESRVLAAGEDP